MRHCDITTFYVSFSTTTFFLFPIMTSVKEKNDTFFWGWYFGFIYFIFWYFFLHVRQHQPWGLADLEQKHDTRSSAGFSSRFVLSWCQFLFICLDLCRYALFLLFLPFFWSCAWKDCTNGLCFLFCFALLFLARRHALIRDAPDDLYFSPPCFFLFAT